MLLILCFPFSIRNVNQGPYQIFKRAFFDTTTLQVITGYVFNMFFHRHLFNDHRTFSKCRRYTWLQNVNWPDTQHFKRLLNIMLIGMEVNFAQSRKKFPQKFPIGKRICWSFLECFKRKWSLNWSTELKFTNYLHQYRVIIFWISNELDGGRIMLKCR
jgi:hypothetical protein